VIKPFSSLEERGTCLFHPQFRSKLVKEINQE